MVLAFQFETNSTTNGCLQKYFSDSSFVCVCNSTYCDEVTELGQINADEAAIYITSLSGKRLEKQILKFKTGSAEKAKDYINLKIHTDTLFQSIVGFGGAFTDAVGLNLNNLSTETQQKLIRSYFAPEGLQYTLGRVPIASCDFSARVYSYLDTKDDFDLETFNITLEDYELKIPYIKAALELEPTLKLFASPWSPPGWMKETGKMVGGGKMNGPFNGKYYQTWAQYFIRFFESYHQEGVDFWGLTLQNEPSAGLSKEWKWQAHYLSAVMQRDFVAELLGPALKNSTITRNLKLMLNDDNRYVLPFHADIFYSNDTAAAYIDGIGVHWYANALFSAHRLTTTHEKHPNKFILATEACNGYVPFFQGPNLGDWNRAEYYAKDIIENLENWAVGWTDWNLCLNEEGGPNFAKNFVDSPIIVNSTADEFYKQPMFYAMGHFRYLMFRCKKNFSKFIRPGATRVMYVAQTNLVQWETKHMDITAFVNNQQVIVVLQNRLTKPIQVQIPKDSSTYLEFVIEASSIATVIFKQNN